jgi:DnaJ-class molecular chaperone
MVDYSKVDYSKYLWLEDCETCGGAGKIKPLNLDKEIPCETCETTGYGKVKKKFVPFKQPNWFGLKSKGRLK